MLLMYINNLVELLASFNIKVKLFADDVKLYIRAVSITDSTTLHKVLTTLVAWADEWQLSVSIEKCCVLHIGKKQNYCCKPIYVKDTPLPLVSSYRDLGVTITNDLSSSIYINEIVAKAH